jgi:hypothetical protein
MKMTGESRNAESPHLTDPELFTLALPPAGEPEALPRHLSECGECARAFSEWKTAVADLADEEADVLRRRSATDWEALEDQTIAAIGRTRIGASRHRARWALAAAVLALLAAALPLWLKPPARAPAPATSAAVLSAQDQADDALLHDVARLARAEDDASRFWNSLAPEPAAPGDERL